MFGHITAIIQKAFLICPFFDESNELLIFDVNRDLCKKKCFTTIQFYHRMSLILIFNAQCLNMFCTNQIKFIENQGPGAVYSIM